MSHTTAPSGATHHPKPIWPADPDAYRVQRLRTGGRLTALRVIEAPNGALFASYSDDADGSLDDFIRAAQEEERSDPHCEKLPSDRALIIAALRKAGIEPALDEAAPKTLDAAAAAVLAAWDDEDNRETCMVGALEQPMQALRAALAKGGA